MSGGEPTSEKRRTIVYCLVPQDLAAKLHEPLRRHFHDDPSVEVVVERRARERRMSDERRGDGGEPPRERRRIRADDGRRAGERRAPLLEVDSLPLPRRARAHTGRLVFAERLEPSTQHAEDLDTARVVARFQAGEEAAFNVLYLRYFDRIYNYLRVVFKNEHQAEDATQQVFVRVLEGLPRYERRSQPFRAWLFRIVRNSALMDLRKEGRIELVDPEELTRRQESEPDGGEDLQVLDWIADRELLMLIERLPLAQRQVLMLRYLLGLRAYEIADILGRTPNDVSQLQSRALRFLRERLVALGRTGARRDRSRIRRRVLQAWVLRSRRYALH